MPQTPSLEAAFAALPDALYVFDQNPILKQVQ